MKICDGDTVSTKNFPWTDYSYTMNEITGVNWYSTPVISFIVSILKESK